MVLNRLLVRQLVRFNCLEAINGKKNCEGGYKVQSSEPLRRNYPVAPPCGGRIFVECTKTCESFLSLIQKEMGTSQAEYAKILESKEKEIEILKNKIISREELKQKYAEIEDDRGVFRRYGNKFKKKLEFEALKNNVPLRVVKEGGKS